MSRSNFQNVKLAKQPVKWVRDLKAADNAAIGKCLAGIDWFGSFNYIESVNEKYEMFLAILRVGYFHPSVGISDYLKRMIHRHKQLWNNALTDGRESSWSLYIGFNNSTMERTLARYNSCIENKLVETRDQGIKRNLHHKTTCGKKTDSSLSCGAIPYSFFG